MTQKSDFRASVPVVPEARIGCVDVFPHQGGSLNISAKNQPYMIFVCIHFFLDRNFSGSFLGPNPPLFRNVHL